MSAKGKHCSTFICSILLISITARLPNTRGSLILEVNEDFRHDDELNPCDLTSSMERPGGYCFCDPEDADEAKDVKCGFQLNPSEKEWQAISLLHAATEIQFMNRPSGSIKNVPPPFVFTGMKSLAYFTMKRSAISSVPSFAFGNSSSLTQIDMQDNGILELFPYSFSNLANLTIINLSENNLTEINRNVFSSLPRLKEVVLMKNGLQIIHDYAFKELKNLEDLALQNNKLMVITREVFTGLGRMKHLDLHENNIEYIGDHVFAEMPRLQDLDLHGNKIVSISSSAFAGLKQLTRLNLKDNKILRLLPETFNHLNKIHFLDIRSNELETLSEALMKPIQKNLKNMNMQLFVEDNRFVCDCRILWLKRLREETESIYVKPHIEKATCNLPENSHKHNSSPTFFHPEGVPPEETTTYAYIESSVRIVNLNESDFNCEKAEKPNDEMSSHSTTYSYHHQLSKSAEESNKHTIVASSSWDKGSRDSHDFQNSEGLVLGGDHNSILREPQATAALEGSDIAGSQPQSTNSVEQKLDTSRITQASPSSAPKGVCDFSRVFSLALMLSIKLFIN